MSPFKFDNNSDHLAPLFAVVPCGCWRGNTIQIFVKCPNRTDSKEHSPLLLAKRAKQRHTFADRHRKKHDVKSQNMRQINMTDYSHISCGQPQPLLPVTSLITWWVFFFFFFNLGIQVPQDTHKYTIIRHTKLWPHILHRDHTGHYYFVR